MAGTYARAVSAITLAAGAFIGLEASAQTQGARPGKSVPEADVGPPPRSVRTGVAFEVRPDGTIALDGTVFKSWAEYVGSRAFRAGGYRCGTPPSRDNVVGPAGGGGGIAGGGTGDCALNFTNPLPIYDPAVVKYRVPVVVHVIQHSNGTGYISPAMIQSQIDVLNEDFLAIPFTNGRLGADVQIEFYLATIDPLGSPTTGITYTTNTAWFNETSLGFFSSLGWDTLNYLNIYTNSASGFLGYATIPQEGTVGFASDGVVILYSAFGRNAPIGAPYNQGRTATHEVGHYLGLFHTFQNGCATTTSPGCYSTGDRICDTNGEAGAHFGCPIVNTCAGDAGNDPTDNYMAYTDDMCMARFTPQQARRMRCTLEHWRSDLYEVVIAPAPCPADLDSDDTVDVDDLLLLIGAWGPCTDCPADLDDDSDVDVDDLLLLVGAWGDC